MIKERPDKMSVKFSPLYSIFETLKETVEILNLPSSIPIECLIVGVSNNKGL